jgi:hypothetical protein
MNPHLRILAAAALAAVATLVASCEVKVSSGVWSYLVTTEAGPGGTIVPELVRVSGGAIVTLSVIPDAGFAIARVTGCDGTLSGTRYVTAPIWWDCVVRASFNPVAVTPAGLLQAVEQELLYWGPSGSTVEFLIDDSSDRPGQWTAVGCVEPSGVVAAVTPDPTHCEYGWPSTALWRYSGSWHGLAEAINSAMATNVPGVGSGHAAYQRLEAGDFASGASEYGQFSLSSALQTGPSEPTGNGTLTRTLSQTWTGQPRYLIVESRLQGDAWENRAERLTRILITARTMNPSVPGSGPDADPVVIADRLLEGMGRFEFHPPADSPLFQLAEPVEFALRIEQNLAVTPMSSCYGLNQTPGDRRVVTGSCRASW